MGRIVLWWNRLRKQDQRALGVLIVVAPIILLWYGVTLPLQDRLKLARRVLEIKRKDAQEFQKKIDIYQAKLVEQKQFNFVVERSPLTRVEDKIRKSGDLSKKVLLNRISLKVGEELVPGVGLAITDATPKEAWGLFSRLFEMDCSISQIQITPTIKKNKLDVHIKLWLNHN